MQSLLLESQRAGSDDSDLGEVQDWRPEVVSQAYDCHHEGRDTLEVAEILGIPEATVRTRLYYARQKLKKLLAKEGFG